MGEWGSVHRAGTSGQAAVWMMAVMSVVTVASMAVVRWGAATVISAQAEGVADLAALAGVVGGEERASEVARRNGATLVDFTHVGDAVTVTVRIRGLVARASAEPDEDDDVVVSGVSSGGLLDSPP